MKLPRALLGVVLSVVTAAGGSAMFRSSDLVVVPVAASTKGLQGSDWHSDLEIMNVDSEPIDVIIVYLPTGNQDNRLWYQNMDHVLGGRRDDGFGIIDEKLKDIPPGNAVVLEDIVKTAWGDNEKGTLLVFGIKAGSYKQTTPVGGTPRKILVNSRTYSLSKNAEDKPLTFGQSTPGIPWYYYIDPGKKNKHLDHVVFSGIREDASYRCALGLANISDSLTSLSVKITLKNPDGTLLAEETVGLKPLAHIQYDKFLYDNLLGQPADKTVTNGTLIVSVAGYMSPGENTTPALLAYVTRTDNLTNDPVYLEQRFEPELPWDCVFNGQNCPSANPSSADLQRDRPFRRPLDPPRPGMP